MQITALHGFCTLVIKCMGYSEALTLASLCDTISVMSPEIKNVSQLTPTIESRVFIDHPNFRFAIGEVAINNAIIKDYENEFFGAAQLRANTYLDSGFINNSDLDSNGTELDQNDYSRSVHLVMLERTAVASMARVVGNMRLIVKNYDNFTPLPVENYCPDVFSKNPISINGVEVSRLIARHEDARIQSSLKWPLFVAGYKYVEHNQLGPVYGLLAPALTKLLKSQHIPVSAIAEERYIKEINATKQPVSIDLNMLEKAVNTIGDKGINVVNGGFSYLNILNNSEAK